MREVRDFNDPKYKKWRKAVYVRDRWKCRMPGCPGTEKKLNAHHIKKWASWPALRFVVSNGITLCATCHERVRGREEEFEALFLRVVNQGKSDLTLTVLMMRYGRKKEDA